MRVSSSAVSDDLIRSENIDSSKLQRGVSNGSIALLHNHEGKYTGVGKRLATKVNVNLGITPGVSTVEMELEKALLAKDLGAHTISDCSVVPDGDALRRDLVQKVGLPVTTIPIYQVVAKRKDFTRISGDLILKTIEAHAKDGASSIVFHAGFNLDTLHALKRQNRVMGIVSKGGSMTAATCIAQGCENPFVAHFEEIVEILREHEVVLNLGNAMRSGSIHDLPDEIQEEETISNARLARRANELGVQVIIEGLGGHVNARDLPQLVQRHNELTGKRPLFVAGPLPTEVGVGYDHIAAAIGGSIAAGHGADYLCAITPAEHLGLPAMEDIREGVVAARIAAHVGDSMKYGLQQTCAADFELSRSRATKDWCSQFQHAIDPARASFRHPPGDKECSMCGKFCALSTMRDYLFGDER